MDQNKALRYQRVSNAVFRQASAPFKARTNHTMAQNKPIALDAHYHRGGFKKHCPRSAAMEVENRVLIIAAFPR